VFGGKKRNVTLQAWMTGYVFLQWIKKVNQVMKSQKKKFFIVSGQRYISL
jgi:hypothetical protein